MTDTDPEKLQLSDQLEGQPLLTTLKLTAPELMHLVGTHDFPAPDAAGFWLKADVERWLLDRRSAIPLPSGRVLDNWRLGFISATEAAAECHISSSTIYRLEQTGDFPQATPMGYRRADIDAWVAQRKEGIPLSNGKFLQAWKPPAYYTRKEVRSLFHTTDKQLDRWIDLKRIPAPSSRGLWDKRKTDEAHKVFYSGTSVEKTPLFIRQDGQSTYTYAKIRSLVRITPVELPRLISHNPPQFPSPISGTTIEDGVWDAKEVLDWIADREAGHPLPGGIDKTVTGFSAMMHALNRKRREHEKYAEEAKRDGVVLKDFQAPPILWKPHKMARYGARCPHCNDMVKNPSERRLSVPEFAPYCSADHQEKHALKLAETAKREAAHATVPYLFRSWTKPYILQKCAHKNCVAPQASDFSSKYCVEHDNLFKMGRLEEKKSTPLPPVALSAAEKERLAASQQQQPPTSQKHSQTKPEELILTPEEIKGNAELDKMLKDLGIE